MGGYDTKIRAVPTAGGKGFVSLPFHLGVGLLFIVERCLLLCIYVLLRI